MILVLDNEVVEGAFCLSNPIESLVLLLFNPPPFHARIEYNGSDIKRRIIEFRVVIVYLLPGELDIDIEVMLCSGLSRWQSG